MPDYYRPENGSLWDFWIVANENEYHMFYLQDERDCPHKGDRRWSIGHAVSDNLRSWADCGIVLRPEPGAGITGLATGSAVYFNGWYTMAVTVHAGKVGVDGIPPYTDYMIRFARSRDLYEWEYMGGEFCIRPEDDKIEPLSVAAMNPKGCWCFGDPYLYINPEKPDELCVLVNTRLRDGDIMTRGAVVRYTTKGLKDFRGPDIVLSPRIAMRTETPQIFSKNGRWYLIISCSDTILSKEFIKSLDRDRLDAAALVFTSDRPDGGYELIGDWALFAGEKSYICKVIPERDVIYTIRNNATQYPPMKGETGISLPHRIEYSEHGGIKVCGIL